MELENNNYQHIFRQSEQYKEKIKQFDIKTTLLFDEFKKLYVITNMNPTSEEYRVQYQNVINSLAEILSKQFSISNDLQVNTDNINKTLFELDILIKKERVKNKELKKKLGIFENKSNAAYEMINDYKDIYDKRYLRNWSLILSSIVCLVAIKAIYKK